MLPQDQKFIHHWTAGEWPLVLVDLLLLPETYGVGDYVYIIEDGVTRAYLAQSSLERVEETGYILLNPISANEIYLKGEALCREMKEFQGEKISEATLPIEWKKIIDILTRFLIIYRYTAGPFTNKQQEALKIFLNDQEIVDAFEKSVFLEEVTEEQKNLVERLKLFSKQRLLLHDAAEKIFVHLQNVFLFLAKKYDFSLEHMQVLSIIEVERLIKNQKVEEKEIRVKLSGMVATKDLNGKHQYFCGNVYREWKRIVEPSVPTSLQGTTAYKGKASGIVVKHVDWTKTLVIPQGAILVTGTTSPQIVPYLKEVKAIVADEGGIMSHAAVVAREFKIPCVIGTKVATQILNDGDLVEVDANTGVVKILNKQSHG
jgi:phosphohistidine swiveling domain-containing protein